MELRPIIVDEKMMVLGGNMRLAALKEIGYTEIDENWIKNADELTEEEKKEFIIKDNVNFGLWDFEALSEYFDKDNLESWGVTMPNFKQAVEEEEKFSLDDNELHELYIKVSKNWFNEIHREIRAKIKDSNLTDDLIELFAYVNNYYSYCKSSKRRFSIIVPLNVDYAKKYMIDKKEIVNDFQKFLYEKYNKPTES